MTRTLAEEKEKARVEVDAARNDLKWANEKLKQLEKEVQRQNDRSDRTFGCDDEIRGL